MTERIDPVIIHLPWFTLYGLPERTGRLARLRCTAAMLVHEVVELVAGSSVAHAMPSAARFSIGAPSFSVPASRRNNLYFAVDGEAFPDIDGPLVGNRSGVELHVYASGSVNSQYEVITGPGPLKEVRLSNDTTGEWEIVSRFTPRTIAVPSDDTTITTVTATNGILDYDVAIVADSDPPLARGSIVLPHPSEWPGQEFLVVGNDMGPSIGYPVSLPAVFGDMANLAPTELDYSVNPVTVEFNLNGASVFATLDQDYTGNAIGAFVALFTDILPDAPNQIDYIDLQGNRVLTSALVTTLTGDAAALEVLDAGTGGASNVADPMNLAAFSSTAGNDSFYAGWDNALRGAGDLNPSLDLTHAYFDGNRTAKSLRVFSDGERLIATRIAMRWEEIYGVMPPIGGPLDDLTNSGAAHAETNAVLKELLEAAFDNTDTGLTATNIGDAIRELKVLIDGLTP